jgi:hypothetical protein
MLDVVRVNYRLHRFEVLAVILGCGLFALTAAIVTVHLNTAAAAIPAGCFDNFFAGLHDPASGCDAPFQAFATIANSEATMVIAAMAVLPFAAGLLLGPPLVAHELETRTAETAWVLAGARWRWLAGLVVPALLLLIVAVGLVAGVTVLLEAAGRPWFEGGPNWEDMGLYGPIVVARALVAFGVGVLLGALVGRTMPALTLGAVASVGVFVLCWFALWAWVDANAILIDGRNGNTNGGLTIGGQWYQTADGTLLRGDEAWASVPANVLEDPTGEGPFAWLHDHYREVYRGVPASYAPTWAAIETIGLGVVAAVLIAASFVVVERRRPS